jgi:hypothetical protein
MTTPMWMMAASTTSLMLQDVCCEELSHVNGLRQNQVR